MLVRMQVRFMGIVVIFLWLQVLHHGLQIDVRGRCLSCVPAPTCCWKPLLHIYSYCANLILSCVGDKNLCLWLSRKNCALLKKEKLLWIRASKNVFYLRESLENYRKYHSEEKGSNFENDSFILLFPTAKKCIYEMYL